MSTDADWEAVKQVVAQGSSLGDGMSSLLGYCNTRHRHLVWNEMAALDYAGDAAAIENWFAGQLPIPEAVEVLWFASWDVEEGFDLRGSTSWSRDPEDWDWWFSNDFDGDSYGSPVLSNMLKVAQQADEDVSELVTWVLTVGYVSLVALQIMRNADAEAVLGNRRELWAVCGHPDAEEGIIVGRLTTSGVDPFKQAR